MASTSTDCPLCYGVGRPCFEIDQIPIWQCDACMHRYAQYNASADHVSLCYGDDYFNAGGAGYSDYFAERDLLIRHGQRYGKLLQSYREQCGSVFSVGTAAGFDLLGMRQQGWQVAGVEPNARLANYAKETLGIDVMAGTLESMPGDQRYDCVVAVQVMAHLVDPHQAAQQFAKLVQPDGLLLIETWNFRSKMARLLGRYWHEYSPPTVLHWYSPQSLGRLMSQYHFQPVAQGRPAKYLSGDHMRSLLEYKLGSVPGGRFAKPVLRVIPRIDTIRYPAEDLFWAIYRRDR